MVVVSLIQLLVEAGQCVNASTNHRQRQFGVLRCERALLQPGKGRQRLKRILDPVVDLTAKNIGGAKGASRVKESHDLSRQDTQRVALERGELAGLMIQHTQRAEGQAFSRLQQRTGIKSEAGLSQAKWIVRHPWILERVTNFDKVPLEDCMCAQ